MREHEIAQRGCVRYGIATESELLEARKLGEHAHGRVELARRLLPRQPILRHVELAQRRRGSLQLAPVASNLVALQSEHLQLRQLTERRDRDETIGGQVELAQLR